MTGTENTLLDQMIKSKAKMHWYHEYAENGILSVEEAKAIALAYARACCEDTLQRASENATVEFKLDPSLEFAYRNTIEIVKSSITNPDNIVIK